MDGPVNGFSVVRALPRRADDCTPRTPSAVLRRERFALSHPEIELRSRREGTRLLFTVCGPECPEQEYDDANAMMDDLETRFP